MTYEEVYTRCKTFKELEEMVRNDTSIAMMLNVDRIELIQRAMNKVCKEKGWCNNE